MKNHAMEELRILGLTKMKEKSNLDIVNYGILIFELFHLATTL